MSKRREEEAAAWERKKRGIERMRKIYQSGGFERAAREDAKRKTFGAIGAGLSQSSMTKRNAPSMFPK